MNSVVFIEVQHGSLTVRSLVCIHVLSCFARCVDLVKDVLRGVLIGSFWSSPKAGAEGLPFGIVRALDPCVCKCMYVCEGCVLPECSAYCVLSVTRSVLGNGFELECGRKMRWIRFTRSSDTCRARVEILRMFGPCTS